MYIEEKDKFKEKYVLKMQNSCDKDLSRIAKENLRIINKRIEFSEDSDSFEIINPFYANLNNEIKMEKVKKMKICPIECDKDNIGLLKELHTKYMTTMKETIRQLNEDNVNNIRFEKYFEEWGFKEPKLGEKLFLIGESGIFYIENPPQGHNLGAMIKEMVISEENFHDLIDEENLINKRDYIWKEKQRIKFKGYQTQKFELATYGEKKGRIITLDSILSTTKGVPFSQINLHSPVITRGMNPLDCDSPYQDEQNLVDLIYKK
jgi:hypothetical protein